MASLSQRELGEFIELFCREGYVLNFTTAEFDAFTMQSVGVAVCARYKVSKARSFISYLESASNSEKTKLILDLFKYYEDEFKSEFIEGFEEDSSLCKYEFKSHYQKQYLKCKQIVQKAFLTQIPLAPIAEKLKQKFSSEYLTQQITLMMEMQENNPTEAIGKAKELIESCCKTILDDMGVQWNKNWSVTKLAGEAMGRLEIMPASISDKDDSAASIKALLGNLLQISTRVAELRNPYGSGHGKSASYKGLESRHAKLAVGSSITFVTFLWDTHEMRKQV